MIAGGEGYKGTKWEWEKIQQRLSQKKRENEIKKIKTNYKVNREDRSGNGKGKGKVSKQT